MKMKQEKLLIWGKIMLITTLASWVGGQTFPTVNVFFQRVIISVSRASMIAVIVNVMIVILVASALVKLTLKTTAEVAREEVKCVYEDEKKSMFDDMVIRDPKIAFENAKRFGMKQSEEWMYMNSTKYKDYFKHHDTREYKTYWNFSGSKTLMTIREFKARAEEF